MELILGLVIIQGLIGAFDLIYHHEILERLPHRKAAATELKLHGIRNFFYAIVFVTLGNMQWHGAWAWVFLVILIIEVLITLWDFVEEDRSRKLPATERVSHTLLALNYGAILALFLPHWYEWTQVPTGFSQVTYGWLSWVMVVFAIGVFVWGIRDAASGWRLAREKKVPAKSWPALNAARQRILITGGTGFIGKELSQVLIDQGHFVTIVTRNAEKAANLLRGRVTLVDSLEALAKEDAFDIVINLAGEPISQRWTEKKKPLLLANRADMTRQLMSYFERAEYKPSVLINGSAIGVYGTSESAEFTESSMASQDTLGAFPRAICEAWEAEANKAKAFGMRVCILRIGVVLEADGGALGQMLFPFEMGGGGPMGNGRQWFSWIHRDDLIRLIIHCINHPEIEGVVNATAPEPVTNKVFSAALGKALKRPAFLPFPAFVVRILFGAMGETLLLAGQRVLPKKVLSSGFKYQYPDVQNALNAIVRQ